MSDTKKSDNAAYGGSPGIACSPSSAHDKAWEKGFVVPIAKEMKARGVAYMLITIRDDGKAAYVLEPNEPECIKCAQNGWSNERNGPCPKFPNCEESFPENETSPSVGEKGTKP